MMLDPRLFANLFNTNFFLFSQPAVLMHILADNVIFVNYLAGETPYLSCSFARKDSGEKALRIELPPCKKHPRTTMTPEYRTFCHYQAAACKPNFLIILPTARLKRLT